MNMVRIRRIMEMRRSAAAPPLLPPKLKKTSFENSERSRQGAKEIVDFHLQLRDFNVAGILPGEDEKLVCTVYESESGGINGPWRLATTSDAFTMRPLVDLPMLFSIEFIFETPQPIRIELCTWSEAGTLTLGAAVFSVAEAVTSRRRTLPVVGETASEMVAVLDVASTLRRRPLSFAIQLEARDFAKKAILDISTIFFQVSGGVNSSSSSSHLYCSEALRLGGSVDGRYAWKPFTLHGEDGDENGTRLLDVVFYGRDEKIRQDVRIGKLQTNVQQLQRNDGRLLSLTSEDYKEARKAVGSVEIARCSPLSTTSFLEGIMAGHWLHLCFAVDFSSPEGEEAAVKWPDGFQEDVEFALRAIGNTAADFAPRSLSAYGFAARLPPLFRESQEFCLNLDTSPLCSSVDDMIETFRAALLLLKPAKSAHLAHVIYHVAKMAQSAMLRRDSSSPMQYYVLVMITRGDISDIKEAVQAVIFASRAPLSIIFIGMGERDEMEDVERLGTSGTRLAFQGRRVARDIVHVSQFAPSRLEEETEAAFSERALYRLAGQFTAFLQRTQREMPPKKNSLHMTSSMSISRPPLTSTPSFDNPSSSLQMEDGEYGEGEEEEDMQGPFLPIGTPPMLGARSPRLSSRPPRSPLPPRALHSSLSNTSCLSTTSSLDGRCSPMPPGSSHLHNTSRASLNALDHSDSFIDGASPQWQQQELAASQRRPTRLSHDMRSMSIQPSAGGFGSLAPRPSPRPHPF